jgi:hypothetical protein
MTDKININKSKLSSTLGSWLLQAKKKRKLCKIIFNLVYRITEFNKNIDDVASKWIMFHAKTSDTMLIYNTTRMQIPIEHISSYF